MPDDDASAVRARRWLLSAALVLLLVILGLSVMALAVAPLVNPTVDPSVEPGASTAAAPEGTPEAPDRARPAPQERPPAPDPSPEAPDPSPEAPAVVEDADALVPESGALLGLYTKPRTATYGERAQRRRWRSLEEAAGRTLDIGHSFYPFTEPFPSWREEWHLDRGRIPMISWNGTSTEAINDGVHDRLIADRADAVRAIGRPVFLRWFWEMDGDKKADIAGDPAAYVAAWKRIHGIFTERGAVNAAWVWCPNATAFDVDAAEQWYPGDAYVDWVCADGYNWPPGRPAAQWETLAEIFAAFHDWGTARGKPMMIAETGVQERDRGEKAEWLADVPRQLRDDLPGVRAFVYFDSDTIHPWWLDSTPRSLDAFRGLAQDPHLNRRSEGDPGG